MKYLGVDYGLKKIGLATGDDASGMAFAYDVIPGGNDAPERVIAAAKREGADAFVVGLPFPTENHISSVQLELTMAFIELLKAATPLPVFFVDEKFSSTEARRLQKEHGLKAAEDAVAAMIILQAYLDELRRAA